MTAHYRFLDQEKKKKDLKRYFDFLVDEYGFIKIPQYQYGREIHSDYIKDDLIIKLVYEGSYTLEILKAGKIEPELLDHSKTTVDFDYSYFKRYDIAKLDPSGKIYNSVSSDNFPDKDLWYFSKLLKDNPEILTGDFSKFTWKYRLLKKLGMNNKKIKSR